ncbi:MAG: hypothetical protein K9M49_06625 [Candidatus Marinimicrobia bacterium]|nr:hypothetical protein [Candidatus Neomarinimicrobiota bacterium]MCF7904812.1 hypothetical protein [Candidatus Neomarinimicrobiota bacterium]
MNVFKTYRNSIQRTLALLMLVVPLFLFAQSREKISITVNEVRLENVLRILSEKSGMKFISDPGIRTDRITLDLKDVAPLEALSIMTELYDLGFQQLGEVDPNLWTVFLES